MGVCPLDDTPLDVVVSLSFSSQMYFESSVMCVVSDPKREVVVVESCFEVVFCHADVVTCIRMLS